MADAMDAQAALDAQTALDKPPLQSKKFLGFIIFHLTMMGLAVLVLAWAWNLDEISNRVFFLLLSIIVVSGFVATGFILGVASLDKYLGLAKIAAKGVANGTTNGSMAKVVSKGTKGMIEVHETPAHRVDPIEVSSGEVDTGEDEVMEPEDGLDDGVDPEEGPDEEMKP